MCRCSRMWFSRSVAQVYLAGCTFIPILRSDVKIASRPEMRHVLTRECKFCKLHGAPHIKSSPCLGGLNTCR